MWQLQRRFYTTFPTASCVIYSRLRFSPRIHLKEVPMIILEAERLLVRRHIPADLDDLHALYSDPDVVRHIPDAPRSREEAKAELDWFLNGHPRRPELGSWATIHKPTGRFIGRCGLLPNTIDGQEEVEVAYVFAKEFWGQGLGTEVAQALVRCARAQLGLTRLICMIEPENLTSARIAVKLGMVFEKEYVDEYGLSRIYAIEEPADILG